MFSGKTSRLLLDLEKDKHAGRHVVALKPQIDTRYDLDTVISHDGLKCAAVPVDNPEQIYAAVETTLDNVGIVRRSLSGLTNCSCSKEHPML